MQANSHQKQVSQLGRRSFLGIALGAVSGLGTLCRVGSSLAATHGAWKMRLSGSTINFSSLPVEEACERLARLGFEAVDVWSAHAGCPHLDDVLTRLGAEGLMKVLEKNGLKLYSFSVYRGGYRKYAKLLGDCGGGVAVRGSTRPCPPEELTKRMKEFIDSLKPDLELAEKYNSYLAIENHGNALLDSLDSMKAFVELNDHPRLGIALAPYHVQARGESVEKAIEICGPQLLYFYAWQHRSGLEQLPGFGPTDFTPLIAKLAEVNYRWYVNPFMHHEPDPDTMSAALAKSRDYLLACYKKAMAAR